MKNKILITGGAGFVGSTLADELLKNENNEILIIDDLTTGRIQNVPDSPRLKFIKGSIGCTAFTNACFDFFMPHYVVHCAASYKNPNDFHTDGITNVIGTINIINACKRHSVLKLIYFQTSLCYGKPVQSPITLTHPLYSGGYDSLSSYACTKTAAEQLIILSKIPYISFRLANAYGARNLSGLLSTVWLKIKNNEPITIVDARRDFIYITDLVDVVLKGLFSEKTGIYHVSTGGDFSIKDIFYTMIEVMGVETPKDVTIKPISDDDVPSILIDPMNTNIDFEWKAKTDIKYGILQAIKWYQNNEFSETFTHLKIK